MNSKERLNAVMDGRVPDRVPINTYELGMGFGSQADHPSYKTLWDEVRTKTDLVVMWAPLGNGTFIQTAHPIEMDVEKRRDGEETVTEYVAHTPEGDLKKVTKVIENVRTTWQVEHWCKTPDDVDRALSAPFAPVAYDGAELKRIREDLGDGGIVMASCGDPLCEAAELMNFGEYTIWAMTETDHFVRTLDRLHERIMTNLANMLDAAPVDMVRICGPEYATPPYMPPELFERFVVPYVREMTELIRSRGIRVRLHSHGKIGRVVDHIATIRPDAIDPCEPPPDGDITLAELKERLPEVTLFGDIELKLLEHGSQEEVRAKVRDSMRQGKPGGRFVLMPTAAPINVPLSPKTAENYITMIETASEMADY